MEQLMERNSQLEKDSNEQENKFLELYEEYNMMNDDMFELQVQLEEVGLEIGEDFEKKDKGKSSGQKIMSILKKTRKKIGGTVRKKTETSKKPDESLNEEESKDGTPSSPKTMSKSKSQKSLGKKEKSSKSEKTAMSEQ